MFRRWSSELFVTMLRITDVNRQMNLWLCTGLVAFYILCPMNLYTNSYTALPVLSAQEFTYVGSPYLLCIGTRNVFNRSCSYVCWLHCSNKSDIVRMYMLNFESSSVFVFDESLRRFNEMCFAEFFPSKRVTKFSIKGLCKIFWVKQSFTVKVNTT